MIVHTNHRTPVANCPQPEAPRWKPIVYGMGPRDAEALARQRSAELRERIEAEAREAEACLHSAHSVSTWPRPDHTLIASLRTLATEHSRMAFHLSRVLSAVAA